MIVIIMLQTIFHPGPFASVAIHPAKGPGYEVGY